MVGSKGELIYLWEEQNSDCYKSLHGRLPLQLLFYYLTDVSLFLSLFFSFSFNILLSMGREIGSFVSSVRNRCRICLFCILAQYDVAISSSNFQDFQALCPFQG